MMEKIGKSHIISLVVLVAVIVAFPQINKLWLESTEEVRSSLITTENNTHYGLPSEWENKQVICIHFPVDDVTSNMTASNFTEGRTYLDVSGSEILIDENSEGMVNYSEDRTTGVCVGGFENYTAGFNFMLEATNVTNGDVYVISHGSATGVILAAADKTTGSASFNGDDAIALIKNGSVVDALSAWKKNVDKRFEGII